MAISVTLTAYNEPFGKDDGQTRIYLHGSVAWVTGTYATGGILPSYSIKDASGQNVLINSLNINPDTLFVFSVASGTYNYVYVKSTGKISIWTAGAEVAAGALPAGVVSDVIEFEAEWVKL